jgi:hypothetical protein
MDEYKQTVGANTITTGTLKDVATAKIGDKLYSYHKEDGMIGGKLGSYEMEANVILLKDDGMKGSGVRESIVS